MQNTPSILLAIPCYNCEQQISRVIQKLTPDIVERLAEIIVIDNQSPDGTIAAAKAAISAHSEANKFTVLRNNDNYSLGGSHKVAFNRAIEKGYEYIAILHGDDQATPLELHRLIDAAIKNPTHGAILGSRFSRKSRLVGYSPLRIWGNRALNLLFTLLTGHWTTDLGSGLNLFRTQDLKDKRYLGFLDTLTFNVDLLLDFYKKGTKIFWQPITWSEIDQVSNAKIFSIGRAILKQLLLWRIGGLEKRIKQGAPSGREYTSTQQ